MTRKDIFDQVKGISNVTGSDTLINLAIQIALNRVHQWYDWPYYVQQGIVNTVAPYTTGTAKVTNASATVTGVGTTWTSAMVGRKFRHSTENAYYIVKTFTSTTSITLSTPYQGTTDSTGSTYSIYKDEYRLAPDVDKYKTSIQIQNGITLQDVPISNFDNLFQTPQSYTDPSLAMMCGTKLDTYTTGTVTGTAAGTTITGSGTAWTSLEGLGRMSDIRVGNYRYTIKSVDSATQVTIFEPLVAAFSASTYEITLNNIVLLYYPIPDAGRNIYYRYYRIPQVLANDYDIPDMPHSFHWILLYGALSIMYMQKGDIQKSQQEAENRFLDGLNMMKVKVGDFANNMIFKRRSVDSGSSGWLDGLEGSNFDTRYSRP